MYYGNPEEKHNSAKYIRSILEDHFESARKLDVRASALKFLSNLSADADAESEGHVIKRILSKGMLFKLMQNNIR